MNDERRIERRTDKKEGRQMKKVRIASLAPAAISQRNNTREEEARRTVTEERKTT